MTEGLVEIPAAMLADDLVLLSALGRDFTVVHDGGRTRSGFTLVAADLRSADDGTLTITLHAEHGATITVGPGDVLRALPDRGEAPVTASVPVTQRRWTEPPWEDS